MKRFLLVLALLCVVGAAGLWWFGYRISFSGGLGLVRTEHAAAGGTARQGGATGGRRRGGGGGGDADTAVPVLATKVATRDVPIYLDGLGTVQAFNTVQVRAMIDGPLIEVRFREGQDVRKGDILALIDPRPTQATLDAAVAKKQQDEASLANARLDAGRYAKLAATAYSSAQQSDTARSQVSQLEAQVRGDQAQIDTARTQLSYTSIVAPFDGRVGIRQVDVGNIVHAGDTTPITVLTQLKPITVVFTLPQQSLPAVAAAMQDGKPQVLALQSGSAREPLDRGELAVLDNQVDSTTGTIKLKATFPNTALKLWPGGFVNVRLLVQTERGAITVPPAAVQRGPRGTYAFVVNPDMSVKRQTITVGHEDEQASIVLSGLSPGDLVVVDGAQRLNDNSKVAVAGPDGNAPDAVPARDRSAPGTATTGQRRQRGAT